MAAITTYTVLNYTVYTAMHIHTVCTCCYVIISYVPLCVGGSHNQKWYILLVTCALVICLICMPSDLGPAALELRLYISGKSLVSMLQLLHVYHWQAKVITCIHTSKCIHFIIIVHSYTCDVLFILRLSRKMLLRILCR